MTIKRCRTALILLVMGAASASSQPLEDRIAFAARVGAYAELHRDIARTAFADAPFTDFESRFAAIVHFRDALRAARPDAREGDVFNPIARAVRRTLWLALWDAGVEPRRLIAEMLEDSEPGARPPAVNESFSWALGNVMPPSVITALPELPPELEYRLVGPDLVLIDVDAGLVVDILRDALIDTTMTE
jgi:hypothetical protein